MLQHGVALATVQKWMQKINRITAGSKVLIYGNRDGVIALGIATPERRDGDLAGTPMRYVRLRDFKRLPKPLSPAEIKKVGGKDYSFRHTVMALYGDEGEKVWEHALKRV